MRRVVLTALLTQLIVLLLLPAPATAEKWLLAEEKDKDIRKTLEPLLPTAASQLDEHDSDVVVVFARLPNGTEIILVNSAPAPLPVSPAISVVPDVLTVIVQSGEQIIDLLVWNQFNLLCVHHRNAGGEFGHVAAGVRFR